MAFMQPSVNAALAQRGDEVVLTVRRDGPGVITQFSWNLADSTSYGLMALSQHVGEATLRLLHDAHPEAFARYPTLVPPGPAEDALTIAHMLIHRSVREKSLAYVDAIDALVNSADALVAASDISVQWAEIRISLLEQYGGR